jgi:hypothetical protein
MRSILSSRSLHLALGVTVGSLLPRPLAASRFLCFLPTRGGGAGGSHFFFFSCRSRSVLSRGHGSTPATQLQELYLIFLLGIARGGPTPRGGLVLSHAPICCS